MPYDGQQAGKRGHADIIRNPDVAKFLEQCEYLRKPGDDAVGEIADLYQLAPKSDELPRLVVASDGSAYAQAIDGEFPSTQMGYVKLSLMAFDMKAYNGLIQPGNPFVEPFKVAEIHNSGRGVAFVLPGANVRYKKQHVQDGFRLSIYEQLEDHRTKVHAQAPSIRDMLYHLQGGQIQIDRCPRCGEEGLFLFKQPAEHVIKCQNPACGTDVYVTDSLRIHEQISDQGDNASAMTRFMNAVEHLQLAAVVKTMADNNLDALCATAIMLDGPLALFGQPAKYHASIQKFYNSVFERCLTMGKKPPVIIGLQKDGMVMEHARSLERHLKPGTFCPITDEYRAKFINGIAPLTENFGHETYYGQDFIYKTDSGRIFDICLAYPFPDKQQRAIFASKKADAAHYEPWLARAFALVRHLEFDLYENAVVPVALAHRHASISLKPGGTLLDVLTKQHLDG
ncbi:DNA double-strand break repair nuclease NurA [Variovorax paradoxus]|uniref:hypothetical protein n=1 Tax=Variovorax paradoxus TaxID=34073 RepID=UPI00399ABA79